ncbi:MAG: hypothetical protein KDH15_13910 [Rhodocyclaceae bacterium]|nr:hypothetical protein [Rhodocyclaceae bacterium]
MTADNRPRMLTPAEVKALRDSKRQIHRRVDELQQRPKATSAQPQPKATHHSRSGDD